MNTGPTRYPRYRVAGDAATRSRQYGELAREQIALTRAGYERTFAAKGISWDAAVATAHSFLDSIEQFFPELLLEMQGIAEGAGLPFADVLTMNCRTEIMWRAAVVSAAAVAPWLHHGPAAARHGSAECSSFALEPHRTHSGTAMVGQNWDWYEVLADGVVVLEVERADGPNYVTVVEAGLLAKTSLNQAGLAIGINTIVCSLDGTPHGVPFHVLVRALADAEHVSDAVEILARVPRASSGNYILAHQDGAILNIETAPGDARTVHPLMAENGSVVHTNHFLQQPHGGYDLAQVQMADSFVRYGRMRQRIAEAQHPLTQLELRDALSDHTDYPNSVCCHPDPRAAPATRWATLVSVVLEPSTRTMHLAEGNPCHTEWNTHDYSELLGVTAVTR